MTTRHTATAHPRTIAADPCAKCPLWNGCGAPLCPLDPNRSEVRTLKGERVCRQLLRAARGEELPEVIAPAVLSALHEVTEGVLGGTVVRGKVAAAARIRNPSSGPLAVRGYPEQRMY